MQPWCGLQCGRFQNVNLDTFYMGTDKCARPHSVIVFDPGRSMSHDGYCDLYDPLLYGVRKLSFIEFSDGQQYQCKYSYILI